MMKKTTLLGAACLLALAGCGGSEGGNGQAADGSANSVAAEAEPGTAAAGTGATGTNTARARGGAGQVQLQPGQWEMKVAVKSAGLPNMPAGVADAMKDIATTTTTCLTEEDAGKPSVFTGNTDKNCKSEGFGNDGGRISGTVTCGGADGQGRMTMKTDGRFTPTAFESTTRSEIEAQGTKITTEAHVTGRRIGECPAGSDPDILEDNLGKKRKAG